MRNLLIFSKIIFIIVLFFLDIRINAQTIFQKTYSGGYNEGYSLCIDNNSLMIVGTTSAAGQGEKDIMLLKTDLNGTILWAKTIGGQKNEVAKAIKKTTDGGFIIVGSTSSYVDITSDSSNCYVIKINNLGNVEWTRSIGLSNAEYANDVIETYDNKFVVVGATKSIGPGNWDVYLFELNSSGSLMWSYAIGSSEDDIGNSLVQTNSNGFIIVGSTTGFSTVGQIPYIIKTSEQGVLQNPSYTFDLNTSFSTSKRYFTKIINGYSNNYVITGSIGLGSIGDAQHFILDIGENITLNWMKKYVLNSGEGVATSIDKTNDGGYILGGTMGFDRLALIKTDALGQLQSAKFYSDINTSYFGKGFDVKQSTDGTYAFLGMRYNASDTSTYLIKTNTSLSSSCLEQVPSIGTATTLSPTINLQNSSTATGVNYIAIDSGVVATYSPIENTICMVLDINQNSLNEEKLVIKKSDILIEFLLIDKNNFIKNINIYNTLGNKVKSIINDNEVSTFGLSKGIYFFQIITNSQTPMVGKFVVK